MGDSPVWVEAYPLPPEVWEPDPKDAGVERAQLPFEAPGPARMQAVSSKLGRGRWRRSPGNAALPAAGHIVVKREFVRRLAAEGGAGLQIDVPTRAGALAAQLGLGDGAGPIELKLGEETRRAVVGLSPLSRTFQVQLPERAVLDFAVGARALDLAPGIEAQGSTLRLRSSSESGPRFAVYMEREGQPRQLIWERTLAAGERERFHDARVELAGEAGEIVRLVFTSTMSIASTGGAEGSEWKSVGFLAEPTVWSRTSSAAPNVIVLLLDTLRADRLGSHGWERARTPFLDGLAQRGVRFADAMSAASWTLPSHASLFTSTYSSQHGLWRDVRLADGQDTVAEVLRAGGYRTAAFAEGGFLKPEHGFARGFERFVSAGRDCSLTFDLAADWMETCEGPFFAFVHTYKVHAPYKPAPAYEQGYVRPYDGDTSADRLARVGVNRAGTVPEPGLVRYLSDMYDAEIAELDGLLAQLFERLEASGRLDNTLVVVTSDHGEEFFEHGAFAHGASLYQEQLHVPLILHWPGHFEGGAVVPGTVHTIDVAPTLVEAAGLALPAGWEGLPLSAEAPDGDRLLFTPMRVRWADEERRGELAVAVREGRWKYVDYPAGLRVLDPQEGPRLYDLEADPGETHNLLEGEGYAEWAARAAELWAQHPELEGILPFELGAEARSELRNLGYVGGDD